MQENHQNWKIAVFVALKMGITGDIQTTGGAENVKLKISSQSKK